MDTEDIMAAKKIVDAAHSPTISTTAGAGANGTRGIEQVDFNDQSSNKTLATGETITSENLGSTQSSSTTGPITEKTALRRFFNPPSLERKHSSGDLHSRLKTRKMLGVGETDNGDIHRSKISQVLGHNEHLYLKLPRGYWNWQLFLSGIMAAQAIIILIFPMQAGEFGLVGVVPASNPIATQYYGATMLALSFLLWKFLNMKDKGVTRAVQYAALIHFVLICFVDIFYAVINGFTILFGKMVLTMLGFRVGISVICLLYLSRIGAASSGLRRSPSYKDLMDQIAK